MHWTVVVSRTCQIFIRHKLPHETSSAASELNFYILLLRCITFIRLAYSAGNNISLALCSNIFPRHWATLYHSGIRLSDRVLPFRVIEKLDRISRVDSKIGGCPCSLLVPPGRCRIFTPPSRYAALKSLNKNPAFENIETELLYQMVTSW